MADTYTWSVNTLDRELSDGVVYTVHWNLAASRANPEVRFLFIFVYNIYIT